MRYKTIKGKKYKLLLVSSKPKVSKELELEQFMAKKGYKPTNKINTTHQRKDGNSVDIVRVSYTNGKAYNVSAYKIWKAS